MHVFFLLIFFFVFPFVVEEAGFGRKKKFPSRRNCCFLQKKNFAWRRCECSTPWQRQQGWQLSWHQHRSARSWQAGLSYYPPSRHHRLSSFPSLSMPKCLQKFPVPRIGNLPWVVLVSAAADVDCWKPCWELLVLPWLLHWREQEMRTPQKNNNNKRLLHLACRILGSWNILRLTEWRKWICMRMEPLPLWRLCLQSSATVFRESEFSCREQVKSFLQNSGPRTLTLLLTAHKKIPALWFWIS